MPWGSAPRCFWKGVQQGFLTAEIFKIALMCGTPMLWREAGFFHTHEARCVVHIWLPEWLAFLSEVWSQKISESTKYPSVEKCIERSMQGNPLSVDTHCSAQLQHFLLFPRLREGNNGVTIQGSLSLLASPLWKLILSPPSHSTSCSQGSLGFH